MINYTEEVKRLDSFIPGDQSKFWRPKAGQYRVKALTELEPSKPYENKEQVKIDLLIGEERYTWTMAKGVSPASSYGQLCNFAINSGNSLINKEFMIVVTNDKKKNTYTIVKI